VIAGAYECETEILGIYIIYKVNKNMMGLTGCSVAGGYGIRGEPDGYMLTQRVSAEGNLFIICRKLYETYENT
jgi:hypothetical protein